LFLGFVLLLITLGLVGIPLLRGQEGEEALYEEFFGEERDGLESSKEALYAALSELEYDYQMGKMSEEDYQRMRRELTVKVAAIIEREEKEGLTVVSDYEGLDDAELRRKVDEEIDAEIEKLLGKAATCPECGETLLRQGQKFCHSCGATLGGDEG